MAGLNQLYLHVNYTEILVNYGLGINLYLII